MKLGITGCMGSGKSTVADIFKENGYIVFDADRLAHDLLKTDIIKRKIRDFFGDEVFDGGEINRQKLAGAVFSSEEKLRFLEELLHPEVVNAYLLEFQRHPGSDFLVQIPLLFEKKLEKHFDYVICVTCDDAIRTQRLQSKGFSLEAIKKRTQLQFSQEKKAKLAHFLINNNESLEELYKSTISLIKTLQSYA